MDTSTANSTILVTGATGFLGGEVVRQLRSQGCRLRTTGRRTSSTSDLPGYRAADLCDREALPDLVAGVDVVIHAAGLAHQHRATMSQNAEFFRINAVGTENVVRAAAAAGCRRIVLVSSVAVYGGGWPRKTEAAKCQPIGPYAESKMEAECVAAEIAGAFCIELVVLRMATLYGENDPGNVGRLLRAIERGRFVWLGRGENRKSLVHVEDAARACVLATCRQELPRDRTFNIASEPCRMCAVVSALHAALGRRPPPLHVPPRMLQMAASLAGRIPGLALRAQRARDILDKWLSDEVYDAALFRRESGWSPTVPLDEGLARQVAAYRRSKREQPAKSATSCRQIQSPSGVRTAA